MGGTEDSAAMGLSALSLNPIPDRLDSIHMVMTESASTCNTAILKDMDLKFGYAN